MIEVGVVIAKDGITPLHWHLPPGRSTAAIPDTRDLWDVLVANKGNLMGFAHSHPGSGVPRPSHEDITSFAAIEAGIGMRLTWWITSRDRLIALRWIGPEKWRYGWWEVQENDPACKDWNNELRRLSYEAAGGL